MTESKVLRLGSSSLCMWLHLSNTQCEECNVIHSQNHPIDPDDFARCYNLLEAQPEWKDKLSVMRSVSPTWSLYIDNWDELTKLYQEKRFKEMHNLQLTICKN